MTYTIIGLVCFMLVYLFLKKRRGVATSEGVGFQNINVAEAKSMIAKGRVSIVDVRTPAEVSQGKIKDAIAINVASPTFMNQISKLDRAAPYIVYCRSGRRSVNACNRMSKEGFTNLYNLKGGFNAWK